MDRAIDVGPKRLYGSIVTQSALFSAHRLDQSVTCLSQHRHQLLWYFHQGSLRRCAARRSFAVLLWYSSISSYFRSRVSLRVVANGRLSMFVFIETLSARLFAWLWCNSAPHRTRVLLTLYWSFCIRLKRCKLISELIEASTNSSVYRLTLFEFYLSKYQTDTKYIRWYIFSTCRYNFL